FFFWRLRHILNNSHIFEKTAMTEVYKKPFPLISVVLTARNEEGMIHRCLQSIFEQNYDNFELIYVDARSTDETFNIANAFSQKTSSFPNCKRYVSVSEHAESPAKGRNIGTRLARGEIIAFTDADCIVEKDWLNKIMSYDIHTIGAVGGSNTIKHATNSKTTIAIDEVLGTRLGSGGAPQFLKIKEAREVYAIPACNMVLRKEIFDNLNGFDERLRYNEDTDLCYRIRKSGLKIIYAPDASVNHFIGLDSVKDFFNFIFRYGFERGKNLIENPQLITRFHIASIISFVAFFSILFSSIFNENLILYFPILAGGGSLVLIINSLMIAINRRSASVFCLAFLIFTIEYIAYNYALLKGMINGLIKNKVL
ncbi:MAG: glycosyltransferase, partial [Candidatus Nitrosotenuis sp.]